MLSPTKSLMALAVVAGAVLLPSTAEAGHKFRFRFFEPNYYTYYPGQSDAYDPYYDNGGDDYYVPPRKRRFYSDQYEQQDSYYDPKYDEPVYVKPKKKKTAKIAPVTPQSVKKSSVIATKKVTPSLAKPVVAKTASGMSCDKAGKIISDYGFSGVKATSCKGQTYAFNATRSGKNYLISLNAASGELTEVKKVQ